MIAWLLVTIVRILTRLTCSLHVQGLEKLPAAGPGLLATNHTTSLEGPVIFSLIWPRPATGLAKRELWANPVTRVFMKAWEIVPVSRGEVDTRALRLLIAALARGRYVGIAPEGTRSRDGALQRGLPGAALLALRTGAPIYPVAQTGFLAIARNLLRIRKTTIAIRFGDPFRVMVPQRLTGDFLREATDEIMCEIASLLPMHARGVYAERANAPRRFIAPAADYHN